MSQVVQSICAEIIAPKNNNLNRINDLLKYTLSQVETEQEEAIKCLRKVFKLFIKARKMMEFKELSTLELSPLRQVEFEAFGDFLKKKFIAFVEILKANVFSPNTSESLKELSLRVLLELSRYHIESVSSKGSSTLDLSRECIFEGVMHKIISDLDAFDSLYVVIEYAETYTDFSVAMLNALCNIAKKAKDASILQNLVTFTTYIPSVDNLKFDALFLQLETASKKKVDLINSNNSASNKRKATHTIDKQGNEEEIKEIDADQSQKTWKESFSQMIFAILGKLTVGHEALLQQFVQNLNRFVFDKMEDPLLLANFLVTIFDKTTDFDMQIVSLSQVFILIGKHELEYPKYYEKLFSLFDQNNGAHQRNRSIFLTSHTPKFLKLVETSLKTSKLSHKVLSSFIRKILRTALSHPPNIILWAVSLIINIIKKNPALIAMLDTTDLKEKIQDHFDANTSVLDDCQAPNSFLWELKSIKNHYLNEVEKIVKVMGTKLDVAQFIELDSFADVQYDHFIRLYIAAAKQKDVFYPIESKITDQSTLSFLNTALFE